MNHLLVDFISRCSVSLVASSATFSLVGIHLQSSTLVVSRISATLLASKTLGYFLVSERIHFSTVSELVQKIFLVMWRLCSEVTVDANLVPITAACNSSLGIVMVFKGATRLFYDTKVALVPLSPPPPDENMQLLRRPADSRHKKCAVGCSRLVRFLERRTAGFVVPTRSSTY